MNVLPLSQAQFPRVHAALAAAVADGTAPGIVAGIWSAREPGVARVGAFGAKSIGGAPVETGTIFDIASVSKVMATATLAAWLVERGWISWSTPLKALVPEARGADGIELRHLLSHTAGYPAWGPFWEKLRAEFALKGYRHIESAPIGERQRAMRRLVAAVEPEAALESRALYSDVSFLLLGFALEEALKMPLDLAVRKFLWDPMKIEKAYYVRVDRPSAKAIDPRVAATEDCPWRGGVVQGQVHDDNCWAMGGYAGHAGVFARAEDVLAFAARLQTGFLSRDILRSMWTRAARPAGCDRTLGWDTPSGDASSAGRHFGAGTVGHLGFTGTSLWIDPAAGLAVTLLTNRVHPSRENIQIRTLRPKFHDAIREDFSAIG